MEKPSKFAVWLSTFLCCMLFWLLLTWSVEPVELILGAVVSAVVAAFSGRFLIHNRAFYLYNPVRLVMILVYNIFIFFWEIIKANVNMARIVLSPNLGNYQAGIIRIPASPDIKSDYGQAMVSNSITLTPGTITMDVAEDEEGNNYYYVHWIDVTETDREKAGEVIKGRMERWIGRIWK
ncbi:MAG: Na+/H+ antiporter subunit E [Clostridiales bacterium]|nr:Na+/H+ antiporter subunit E [Clostridiales bacterium]